jgi:hypothetical protein
MLDEKDVAFILIDANATLLLEGPNVLRPVYISGSKAHSKYCLFFNVSVYSNDLGSYGCIRCLFFGIKERRETGIMHKRPDTGDY